jgi:hypothetical protein
MEVYIFEIYVKFCVFGCPLSPYFEEKKVWTYILDDPKCCRFDIF